MSRPCKNTKIFYWSVRLIAEHVVVIYSSGLLGMGAQSHFTRVSDIHTRFFAVWQERKETSYNSDWLLLLTNKKEGRERSGTDAVSIMSRALFNTAKMLPWVAGGRYQIEQVKTYASEQNKKNVTRGCIRLKRNEAKRLKFSISGGASSGASSPAGGGAIGARSARSFFSDMSKTTINLLRRNSIKIQSSRQSD